MNTFTHIKVLSQTTDNDGLVLKHHHRDVSDLTVVTFDDDEVSVIFSDDDHSDDENNKNDTYNDSDDDDLYIPLPIDEADEDKLVSFFTEQFYSSFLPDKKETVYSAQGLEHSAVQSITNEENRIGAGTKREHDKVLPKIDVADVDRLSETFTTIDDAAVTDDMNPVAAHQQSRSKRRRIIEINGVC